MKQKAAAVRASMSSDEKACDWLGQPFPTEHVVVTQKDWFNAETGEEELRTITTLVSPDGDRLSSQSVMVAQALRSIVAAFGPPPWKPALNLRLSEIKGGKFGRYYVLEPV